MGAVARKPVSEPAGEYFHMHPVASLLVDGSGVVIDVNQEAEALLIRSCAQLVGQPLISIVRASKRERLVRVLCDPAASARLFAIELASKHRATLMADVIIGAAQADGRRLVALHHVPQSVRESGLRPGAAARSASAAAAMLAHEIKNPLSGIKGAAQLLGRQADHASRPLAELICGEVDRIAALIDSMQGFTRGAPLSIGPLNPFPAISQARELAEAGFAADAIFEERFDPSIPLIFANHDALVQVLINLIKNAREAALPDHRATIRLSTGYRHGFAWDAGDGAGHVALPIEISVLDDGPGVNPALESALFDPFVTSKKDGQGLGLSLVDKLMREMGGLIQHDRLDGWTRFRLCFREAR